MKEKTGRTVAFFISNDLEERVRARIAQTKDLTGLSVSFSEAIRALVEKGLQATDGPALMGNMLKKEGL